MQVTSRVEHSGILSGNLWISVLKMRSLLLAIWSTAASYHFRGFRG